MKVPQIPLKRETPKEPVPSIHPAGSFDVVYIEFDSIRRSNKGDHYVLRMKLSTGHPEWLWTYYSGYSPTLHAIWICQPYFKQLAEEGKLKVQVKHRKHLGQIYCQTDFIFTKELGPWPLS